MSNISITNQLIEKFRKESIEENFVLGVIKGKMLDIKNMVDEHLSWELITKVTSITKDEYLNYDLESNFELELTVDLTEFKIHRITDENYLKMREKSIIISINKNFFSQFYSILKTRKEYLNFAKMYYTLTDMFGKSGIIFNDKKSSFIFPFIITFEKGNNCYYYVLNIYNEKQNILFDFFKIVPSIESYDREKKYIPFEEEISEQQIFHFIMSFYYQTYNHFEIIKNDAINHFYRKQESEKTIFGYNGSFYQNKYDSEVKYKENLNLLKRGHEEINCYAMVS